MEMETTVKKYLSYTDLAYRADTEHNDNVKKKHRHIADHYLAQTTKKNGTRWISMPNLAAQSDASFTRKCRQPNPCTRRERNSDSNSGGSDISNKNENYTKNYNKLKEKSRGRRFTSTNDVRMFVPSTKPPTRFKSTSCLEFSVDTSGYEPLENGLSDCGDLPEGEFCDTFTTKLPASDNTASRGMTTENCRLVDSTLNVHREVDWGQMTIKNVGENTTSKPKKSRFRLFQEIKQLNIFRHRKRIRLKNRMPSDNTDEYGCVCCPAADNCPDIQRHLTAVTARKVN